MKFVCVSKDGLNQRQILQTAIDCHPSSVFAADGRQQRICITPYNKPLPSVLKFSLCRGPLNHLVPKGPSGHFTACLSLLHRFPNRCLTFGETFFTCIPRIWV